MKEQGIINITTWIEPDYVVPGDLATVATSGSYNDLTSLPDLSVLADIVQVANYAALPGSGDANKVYITKDTGYMYRWSGSAYVQLTDQTAIWGQISGTLSSQTDLQSALNAKYNTPAGTTGQYVRGDGTLGTFPSIPTVNDNSLTLLDSTTVEHDANDTVFTANSATNKSFKLKLTSTVTTDIAKGVTAQGWGNHASAGYIKKVEDDTTPKLAANLNANSKKITGLADGIDPNDAVNRSQLDAAVGSGLTLAGSSTEIQFNNGSGNLGASSLLKIDTTAKVLTTPDLKLTVTGNNNTAADDTEAVFKIKNTTVGPDTIVEVLANLGNGNDVIFARYIA